MIQSIVYSKDRACQLAAFLESATKLAGCAFAFTVLYFASNEDFEKGYSLLKPLYPWVKFVRQENEKSFLRQNQEILESLDSRYISFFVDDIIFYRQLPPYFERELDIFFQEKNACFSLRLGLNTTECYMGRCRNIFWGRYDYKQFSLWNWNDSSGDAGYPLSVDGHVFRRLDFLKITKGLEYKSPNSFEASLQSRLGIFAYLAGLMMGSYRQSLIVNVASNRVGEYDCNRCGDNPEENPNRLNNLFLSGIRISPTINPDIVNGCHIEKKLDWYEP